jgi:hypothetical protein
MNKLHGDVLRVCSVGPTAKGKQPPSPQKAFRHGAGGFGQAGRFPGEKIFHHLVPSQQALPYPARQLSRNPFRNGHGFHNAIGMQSLA